MLYVCVSGGADSTAVALLLYEQGIDFEMVFADTGAELPEVYELLPRLQAVVQKHLHVVSNGSFFQWLVRFNYFLPSARQRWCTRVLKQKPQDEFFKQQKEKHGTVQIAIGIRVDEQHRIRRSKERYSEGNYTFPLVEAGFTKQDVFRICERYDLLNPVYGWRSNVSCFCCPFQRKSDWIGLLKHHPDLFAVAEAWEKQSSIVAQQKGYMPFCWGQKFTLEELRQSVESEKYVQMELFGENVG